MAETSISEGTVISHYRIVSRIGAGGMGEVYKAQDTTLERPVALKILPPEVLKDTDRVRRFVGEAKSASALNHPHIVTIHEIGQATLPASEGEEPLKIHYIAMEYIEGTTLRAHIYRDTELKKLVDLMSQSADGLSKAHNAGIVHRDLKPDNLMVTTDGYAKIVDFGLAKLTEKREGASDNVEQTQEGMILGTAGYMSPEQVQGKLVDQRSDIFSFGCILYECATQSKPFQSETAIDTMHRIVFGQPQPIGDLNPEVPEELARIIRKTLAKDPDERYQTIKEIAVDLRNLSRSWDQQMTVGGYSMTAAPAFPTSSRIPTGPGTQPVPSSPPTPAPAHAPMLDESQREPAQIYTESLDELPPPKRYIPIGRWVFRTVLIAIIALSGWLWYTHPEVEPLAEGPLETFPLLEQRQLEAGAEDVAWEWRSRDDTAVPVRVAAVAQADPGFTGRTPPTIDDLRKEGAVAELFRSKKLPGLSPISRSVAEATVLEPGAMLNPIRSYVVAFDLERKMPKTRVLELYINTIEFSPTMIGVEAASQHYFDKSAGRLNDQEAALLLASIGAPEVNLKNPPDWLVAKQEAILEAMKEE